MSNNKVVGSILLALTAFIWGLAFVAQSVGMEYVQPFTFNCVRFAVGGVVLIPCIAFLNWFNGKSENNISENEKIISGFNNTKISENVNVIEKSGDTPKVYNTQKKELLKAGILCGIFLFTASSFQQIGIMYTSVGKAGFITALYIIIVPVLGIFLGKKVGKGIGFSVILAIVGMYCLCITDGFVLEIGDILELLCAFFFSLHIMTIDKFASKVDCVKMSCIQFFVCAFLSMIFMIIMEEPRLELILAAWMPILYAGVMSCGIAYTLQVVGQKSVHPVVASLIMSLESVFAVLAAWVILGQTMSVRESIGCILVFCGIIIVQLPQKKSV